MPVSNPPFGYYSVSNSSLYIYSRGFDPSSPGNAKSIEVYAPNGADAGSASYGGYASLIAGDGAATSARPSHGGNAYLKSGDGGNTINDGYNSYGGTVYFYAGNGGHVNGAGSGSYGGNVFLRSGDAYSEQYYSIAGTIGLYGGDANKTVSYGNNGGAVVLRGGVAAGGSSYNKAGNIEFHGGNAVGIVAGDHGGDIILKTGNATNAGRGGDVHITLYAGVARNGQFILTNIPAIAPAVSGAVWNNLGVLTIVP